MDRNSRPLQDAVISNCGELIRQIKGKFFKKFQSKIKIIQIFAFQSKRKRRKNEVFNLVIHPRKMMKNLRKKIKRRKNQRRRHHLKSN